MTRLPAQPCGPDLSAPCDGSATKALNFLYQNTYVTNVHHSQTRKCSQGTQGNRFRVYVGPAGKQEHRGIAAAQRYTHTHTHMRARCTENGESLG